MSVQTLQSRLAVLPTAKGRFREIAKWAATLSDDAIDGMGGNAVVATQVAALYDTWVRPYDLPGVPNLVEPLVDDAIKNALVALIWSVDDEPKA